MKTYGPPQLKSVLGFTGKLHGALFVTGVCYRDRPPESRGFSWVYVCECACGKTVYAKVTEIKQGRDRCSNECEAARKKILATHREHFGVDPEEMDRLARSAEGAFQ